MIHLQLYTLAAVAGALTHQIFFKRGEHHLDGPKYAEIFLGVFLLSTAICALCFDMSFVASFQIVGGLSSLFLAGLYTSLLTYRVCFHPLNRFRGPIMARVSNLWLSSQCLNVDAHKQLLGLHRKYDTDFLRVGSSDLSVTHPEGVSAIYGPQSSCVKSDWYDTDWPNKPMMAERNKARHDSRRRKFWSAAFSDKALRGYQQRIRKYEDVLRNQLLEFKGRPVNVRDWFHFYAFDTMGDLAFGQSFGNLTEGDYHPAAKLIKEGLDIFSFLRMRPFPSLEMLGSDNKADMD